MEALDQVNVFTTVLRLLSKLNLFEKKSLKTRRQQLAKNNWSKIQGRKLVETQLIKHSAWEKS